MRAALYARIGVSLIMFHAPVTRTAYLPVPRVPRASGGFPSRRSPRYGASVLSRFRREDPFSPPHDRELRRFGTGEFSPPSLSLSLVLRVRSDGSRLCSSLSLSQPRASRAALLTARGQCAFHSLPFGFPSGSLRCTSCRKVPFDR